MVQLQIILRSGWFNPKLWKQVDFGDSMSLEIYKGFSHIFPLKLPCMEDFRVPFLMTEGTYHNTIYIIIYIYIHNHIYTKTRVWITIAIPNKGLFYWSGLSEGCLAAKCSTKYWQPSCYGRPHSVCLVNSNLTPVNRFAAAIGWND